MSSLKGIADFIPKPVQCSLFKSGKRFVIITLSWANVSKIAAVHNYTVNSGIGDEKKENNDDASSMSRQQFRIEEQLYAEETRQAASSGDG